MKIQGRRMGLSLVLGLLVLGQGQNSFGMGFNKDGENSKANQKDKERKYEEEKYEEEKTRVDNEDQSKNAEIKDEILNPQNCSSAEWARIKKQEQNRKKRQRQKHNYKIKRAICRAEEDKKEMQEAQESFFKEIKNSELIWFKMTEDYELNMSKRYYWRAKLKDATNNINNINNTKYMCMLNLEGIKADRNWIVLLEKQKLTSEQMLYKLQEERRKIEKWNDPQSEDTDAMITYNEIMDSYSNHSESVGKMLLDVGSEFKERSSELKKFISENLEDLNKMTDAIVDKLPKCKIRKDIFESCLASIKEKPSAEDKQEDEKTLKTLREIDYLEKKRQSFEGEKQKTQKFLDDVEFEIKSYNEYEKQKLLEIESKNNKINNKEKNKGNEEEEEKQGWIPNQNQSQIQSQIKGNKNHRTDEEEEKKGS